MKQQVKLIPGYFWKMAKHDYQKPGLAIIREFAQNSIDSGAKNIEFILFKELKKKNTYSYHLQVTDDGSGMTEDIIKNKLLTLGESGKEGKDGSVGGFGKAKEILFFSHANWEIYTGDIAVQGQYESYNIVKNKRPVGSSITTIKGTVICIEIIEELFNEIAENWAILSYFETSAKITVKEGQKLDKTWETTVLVKNSDFTPFKKKTLLKEFNWGTLNLVTVKSHGFHFDSEDYSDNDLISVKSNFASKSEGISPWNTVSVYGKGCFMFSEQAHLSKSYQLIMNNYTDFTINRDAIKSEMKQEVMTFIAGFEKDQKLKAMDKSDPTIILKGKNLILYADWESSVYKNYFTKSGIKFNLLKEKDKIYSDVFGKELESYYPEYAEKFKKKFELLLALRKELELEDIPLIFGRSIFDLEKGIEVLNYLKDKDWEGFKGTFNYFKDCSDLIMKNYLTKLNRFQITHKGIKESGNLAVKTFGDNHMFKKPIWKIFKSYIDSKEKNNFLTGAEYGLTFVKNVGGSNIQMGRSGTIISMNPSYHIRNRFNQEEEKKAKLDIKRDIFFLCLHELTHLFISGHDSSFSYVHDDILKSCLDLFYGDSHLYKEESLSERIDNKNDILLRDYNNKEEAKRWSDILESGIKDTGASLHRFLSDSYTEEIRNFAKYSDKRYHFLTNKIGNVIGRLAFLFKINLNKNRLHNSERKELLALINDRRWGNRSWWEGISEFCSSYNYVHYEDFIKAKLKFDSYLQNRDYFLDSHVIRCNKKEEELAKAKEQEENSEGLEIDFL